MTGLLDDLKNAFNKPNNSLYQLIAINIVVFVITGVIMVISMITGHGYIWDVVEDNLSISPQLSVLMYKPWTIITYMFVHDLKGIFHVLFNMLAFYWFGQLIMEYLGSKKLLSLYILGGLAGAILFIALTNTLPLFEGRIAPMIGASAAVYAVVVAAATLLPDYTFFLLFLGPIRIKYIAAVYIFISFLGSVGPNAGGNIAHLGGALLGFVFIVSLRKGTDIGKPVIAILDGIGSLFKKKSKIKVSYNKGAYAKETSRVSSAYKSKSTTSSSSSNIDQDEIDAILDKISQSGYDKLTTEEKQKLFKASQKK